MKKALSTLHKKFLHRVKILRLEKNWSQKKTADYLGMKPTSYSDLEQGAKRVDLDKLVAIANLFAVPVGFLINGERGDLTPKRRSEINDLFDL
tara:strand:- start:882 stop:1160 length:279 start_codon:yes stop_codon:yes gene_type:complete